MNKSTNVYGDDGPPVIVDPPGGGGGVGDIKLIRPDGTIVEVVTVPGLDYLYATDGQVSMYFNTALLTGTTGTYCNLVTVTVPGHTVSVTQTSVTLDGKAQSKTSAPVAMGTGSLRWWVDPNGKSSYQGDTRVDIKYGDWWIACIQDPGVMTSYHPISPMPTLYRTPHIGFYVNTLPGTKVGQIFVPSNSITGMIQSILGGLTIVPSQFVALI